MEFGWSVLHGKKTGGIRNNKEHLQHAEIRENLDCEVEKAFKQQERRAQEM